VSRGQQNETYKQTKGESTNSFGNAENAYKNAEEDIGDYKAQLGRYASANPYLPGGEFQQQENMIAANTSDAAARSAGAALQETAARTGQNPAGVIGATAAMERQGARDIQGEEAGANKERIAGEAGYNKSILAGSEFPVAAESDLGKGYGSLYGTALGAQEQAAATPGFLDQLEAQLAGAGTAFLGGVGEGMGKGVGEEEAKKG
jgi:hypothetical protein